MLCYSHGQKCTLADRLVSINGWIALMLPFTRAAPRESGGASLLTVSTFSALTFEAIGSLGMLSLYAYRRKCQPFHYKNIVQKSAADFMQTDGMDIIYIIVYNSWTTAILL